MSEFDYFFADACEHARDAVGMGEDAVLDGQPVRVVTENLQRTAGASPRGGGRIIKITGIVTMALSDWRRCAGKQGSVLVLSIGEMRITNTPNEARSVVSLEITGTAQP